MAFNSLTDDAGFGSGLLLGLILKLVVCGRADLRFDQLLVSDARSPGRLSQRPGIYTKVHIHGANGASVGVQTDTGATFVAGMGGITEPDSWALVSNNVWGCEDNPGRDGKSDFMFEVHDGKLWTFGGDREVISPWPQDNDVWVAELSE